MRRFVNCYFSLTYTLVAYKLTPISKRKGFQKPWNLFPIKGKVSKTPPSALAGSDLLNIKIKPTQYKNTTLPQSGKGGLDKPKLHTISWPLIAFRFDYNCFNFGCRHGSKSIEKCPTARLCGRGAVVNERRLDTPTTETTSSPQHTKLKPLLNINPYR